MWLKSQVLLVSLEVLIVSWNWQQVFISFLISFFSFARTMPLLLGRFFFKSVGLLNFCSWYVLLQFGAALFEQELFEFSLLS